MSRKTLGLRERQARKRHRRASYGSVTSSGSWYVKAGHKHFLRWWGFVQRQTVAESEKRATGAPETN